MSVHEYPNSGPGSQAAGGWISVRKRKPPLHTSVLARIVGGAGSTFDVVCYLGKQPDGSERWVLSDVFLQETRISHWATILDIDFDGDCSAENSAHERIDA